LIGLTLLAGATAPAFAQSLGPAPGLNENGLPPGYDNDRILPNNDKAVPDSARGGDDAPVGSFGNPGPGTVYTEPAPGYGVGPGAPAYPPADPMYPEQ
jgi:hypothetical protein